MDQAVEPILETQPLMPTARFAGFWRRVGALVVDAGVQGLLGLPLGLLLGERLAPVGSPARLVGILIVLPYVGVLGSRVGGGQTLGKRLLGLRVADAGGQPLPLARSFARAALLAAVDLPSLRCAQDRPASIRRRTPPTWAGAHAAPHDYRLPSTFASQIFTRSCAPRSERAAPFSFSMAGNSPWARNA